MIQFDEHIFQMGWFNHQLAPLIRSRLGTLRFSEVHLQLKGLEFGDHRSIRSTAMGCWYMGVSLKGGTPISHLKMIIFSRKTNGCWVPAF